MCMDADINLMPQNDEKPTPELSIRSDPVLEAAGWVRRHFVDPTRAKETTELYESLGFEVLSRNPTPQDFGPACSACAVTACKAYVLIYTRRRAPNAPKSPQSQGENR
jgi:hypothetical protein